MTQLPPKIPGHWLMKSSTDLAKDAIGFIDTNTQAHGRIAFAETIIQDICIVADPDGIKHILQDNNRNYTKSFAYQVLRIFLGNGLLTSEGDFWRKQRRLAQPAFHKERLKKITETMSSCVADMEKKWDQQYGATGGVINVGNEMNEVTLNIVAAALFGADVGDKLEDIRKSIGLTNEFALKRIYSLVRLPLWVPLPDHVRYNRAAKTLNDVIYGIIEDRRKESSAEGADLLAMLMEARDEDTGEGMSDEQLRDEAMTLFIAGHETTANGLTWLWYLLAKHPEVAAKLHEEVDSVLGGRTPGFGDLMQLVYTKQIVEEAFRLYPPAWIIGRKMIEDDVICGYDVKAGTNMLMPTYHMHRDPEYWEEPERFNPDRFHPDRRKSIRKFTYFPFGGGPRLCIGNSFALMEAQIIVAALAQKFNFEWIVGTPEPEIDPLITLRSKDPIKLKITRRS